MVFLVWNCFLFDVCCQPPWTLVFMKLLLTFKYIQTACVWQGLVKTRLSNVFVRIRWVFGVCVFCFFFINANGGGKNFPPHDLSEFQLTNLHQGQISSLVDSVNI